MNRGGVRSGDARYLKGLPEKMPRMIAIAVEVPDELAHCQLPPGVHRRLHELLDKQENGVALTDDECREAEGLVDVADFLSVLRLRARRLTGGE